jgi:hypothetical protein
LIPTCQWSAAVPRAGVNSAINITSAQHVLRDRARWLGLVVRLKEWYKNTIDKGSYYRPSRVVLTEKRQNIWYWQTMKQFDIKVECVIGWHAKQGDNDIRETTLGLCSYKAYSDGRSFTLIPLKELLR